MSDKDEIQRKVDRILGSIGPKPLLIITVRRVEPKRCAKYLGTVYVEDEDVDLHELIQQEFGGGRFYLQIKDSNGRYLAHRTVAIAGAPWH